MKSRREKARKAMTYDVSVLWLGMASRKQNKFSEGGSSENLLLAGLGLGQGDLRMVA